MTSKICTRCKLDKDISAFPNQKKGKNGKASECQRCYSDRLILWKLNNPEMSRIHKLKHNFNISKDEYNLMFTNQNGCCKICKRHQSEFKRRFAVDHCHISEKIRGLLCGNCNTALGLLKEDLNTIGSLIEYIKENKNKFDKK